MYISVGRIPLNVNQHVSLDSFGGKFLQHLLGAANVVHISKYGGSMAKESAQKIKAISMFYWYPLGER